MGKIIEVIIISYASRFARRGLVLISTTLIGSALITAGVIIAIINYSILLIVGEGIALIGIGAATLYFAWPKKPKPVVAIFLRNFIENKQRKKELRRLTQGTST